MEEFSLGPGTAEERGWRELWRRYFKTLTIEERYNPKCQSTHLPKRYRHVMTEFMTEPAPAVPSPAIAVIMPIFAQGEKYPAGCSSCLTN